MNNGPYKNNRFIIAEILACVTFVLNTICVVTAKEIHQSFSPVWLPNFGLIYWLKTILAIVGIFYFFSSAVFIAKKGSHYISIPTLAILRYSVPGVNFLLYFPIAMLFIVDKNQTAYQAYGVRIPVQIIWSIPAFLVAVDFIKKLVKNIIAKNA